MADTAALIVALSAQLTKFEKDMKSAVGIADRRTKEIETSFSKMNRSISSQMTELASLTGGSFGRVGGLITRLGPLGATAAVGILALGTAFTVVSKAVHEYIQEAGKLRDASDTTGLTITQLKELSKAGLEVGVSSEQVEAAVGKMTVSIDQLREASGPLYDKLKKVPGVMLAITNAEDAADAIDILIQHFNTLSSEFEKNAFLKAVFGRGGLPIGRLFQQLADAGGLKAVVENSKQAGTAINENMVKRVDELSDQIALVGDEIKTMWGEAVASPFLGWVLSIAQGFRDISKSVTDAINEMKKVPRAPLPSQNQAPGLPPLAVQPRSFTGTSGAASQGFDEAGMAVGLPTPAAPTPLPRARPEDTLDQQIAKLKALMAVLGDVNRVQNEFRLKQLEMKKAVGETNVSLEDQADATRSQELQKEIDQLQDFIGVVKDGITTTERLQLEELKIMKLRVDRRITAEQAKRAEQELIEQENLATLQLRERLGVATEVEIAEGRRIQFLREANRAKLDATAIEQGLNRVLKESRDAYEAQVVALSKLPSVTRAAFDATFLKQFDQFAVTTMGNFENAIADIATSSKSLKDAFKDLADSIIRDLIRMSIRLAVTKPLFDALGGLFGGGGLFSSQPFTGGLGRQHGGPVSAGQPYVVGEKGPELFVPKGAGNIVPNKVMNRTGAAGSGLKVVVNNYASGETETTQQRQQGPSGEELIIGIVKKTIASGQADGPNRARFGLRAQKVR